MARIALVLVSAAALAGCGGDDDRLTREEFTRQATAICDDLERRTEQVDEPRSPADVDDFAADLRAIVEDGLSDLRELRPPEDLEQPYERYLESGEELRAELERMAEAAADGDAAGVQAAVERGEELSESAGGLARDAGIPGCED
jgi:hypothetical protein